MAIGRSQEDEREEERIKLRGKLPPASQGHQGARPVLGSLLLPKESHSGACYSHLDSISTAVFQGTAHSWPSLFGLFGFTANNEETKIRVLISHTTPPVLLLELNSVQTFNMLDPVLAIDMHMALDTILRLARRSPVSNGGYPLGFVLQGAGPHLCPGGNHHPVNPPGATPWVMTPYMSSLAWIRMRELALPACVAMTGSAIGGGVAISLQCTARVAASAASMAFGNLSRGANPLMWLSKGLPNLLGATAAASIYLTDATVSSCGAQRQGLINYVVPSFIATKSRALAVTRGMASLPSLRQVSKIHMPLSVRHYSNENLSFMKSMKGGVMFANVGATAHETAQLPMDGLVTGRALREVREEETRPSPRPFPGVAEQERSPRPFPSAEAQPVRVTQAPGSLCTSCGYRGSEGMLWGQSFYCDWCWPAVSANAPAEAAGSSEVEMVDASPYVAPYDPSATCAQCGDDFEVTRHGDAYYCGVCGPRMGLHRAQARPVQAAPACASCGYAGPKVWPHGGTYCCEWCWPTAKMGHYGRGGGGSWGYSGDELDVNSTAASNTDVGSDWER